MPKKVKMHLSIGYSNASRESTFELSEYWETLSEEEKEKELEEILEDWANNYIETGYEIIDDIDD